MSWQAKWIWAREHSETPNFYMYARKEFELLNAGGAQIRVACSTEYKLYINGRYIGRGPSPCHPSFQYFDEYDASHAVRTGRNVIAAICYNYGVNTHCRPQAPGGFLLQAEMTNGSGGTLIVATDESWKVMPADEWDSASERMFWTIGFQEVYDSRKKPVGWNVAGFNDDEWEQPLIIGDVGIEPWTLLVPREIPALRECEVLPQQVLGHGVVDAIDDPALDVATRMSRERNRAVRTAIKYPNAVLNTAGEAAVVSPGSDTFLAVDFGREVVGFPAIRVRDGGPAIVDIGYSEALDDDGDVFPTRQGILQGDRLILHGGRQEWQAFGRRAFRYLQLTFRQTSAPVYLESIAVSEIGYPVEQVSSFECSDDLLNEIWRTGAQTLRACMQDAFEDCPLREHGQYPGDARVQALMNYYCFFDTRLAAKALWQFVQCQSDKGFFNDLWPSGTNHVLPDYNLVWVMMLHDYYLYSADRALVERLYPNLRLLMENWVRSQESENGLLTWDPDPTVPAEEWWLFIDHAGIDKRGEVAAYNAFYYQALRDAAKLASWTGSVDDSVEWSIRAEKVCAAFNERFWSEQDGVYVDCNVRGEMSRTVSVQTNTLAVLFGLADSDRSKRISDYLASDRPAVQSSGPYFNFYVLQAMAKSGDIDEALSLIRSDWGTMLRRGATTWWEVFHPTWPENTICPESLCHGWSGAPTYFLPAEVLGVKPSLPESGVVVIQPRPGDLQWARGHVRTHAGDVDVEWWSSDDSFRIAIDAPHGFIVALPVGRFRDPQIEEVDLSPETPERRARKSYGWGNVIWRSGEEHDPYLDWLKTQEAQAPYDYNPKQRCSSADGYIWVRESAHTHVRYEVRESPLV